MVDLTEVIFACDESGAKGYADRDETYPGEVGVFAGILIPSESQDNIANTFQTIYDQYKPEKGKLHITELPDNLKESKHLDAYANWGAGDLIGDRLYRHPKYRED